MFEVGKTYYLKDGYSFFVRGYVNNKNTFYNLIIEPSPVIDIECTTGYNIQWVTSSEEQYRNWEYEDIKVTMRNFRKVFRECYPEFCL